jgi:LacI family transcriptional regulator
VLNEAVALGYVADARVSDVMSSFRKSQHPKYRETIAFLQSPHGSSFHEVFKYAEKFAISQGYRVENILIPAGRSRSRQLNRILTTRGIRGLLITPGSTRPLPHFTLPWQHFASVIIGSSLVNKGIPRVRADHFQLVSETLRQLVKLNYRNIGLLIDHDFNERTGRHLTGAYLATDHPLALSKRSDSIRLIRKWNAPQIKSWIQRKQFDCLIIDHTRRKAELEALGFLFPSDLGLSCLSVQQTQSEVSGIYQNAEGMAKAALSLLTVLLKTNQTGLQSDAPVIHTPGTWQSGQTLKKQ